MKFIIYAASVGFILGALGIGVLDEPAKFFMIDIPLLIIGYLFLEGK